MSVTYVSQPPHSFWALCSQYYDIYPLLIEASGRITLDRVRDVAETGVDFISVGALTHSAKALDINLELEAL